MDDYTLEETTDKEDLIVDEPNSLEESVSMERVAEERLLFPFATGLAKCMGDDLDRFKAYIEDCAQIYLKHFGSPGERYDKH